MHTPSAHKISERMNILMNVPPKSSEVPSRVRTCNFSQTLKTKDLGHLCRDQRLGDLLYIEDCTAQRYRHIYCIYRDYNRPLFLDPYEPINISWFMSFQGLVHVAHLVEIKSTQLDHRFSWGPHV